MGPVLSEIICLIKISDGRQTDGWTERQAQQTENGNLFLEVVEGRENVKVESRPTDSITILSSLKLGK